MGLICEPARLRRADFLVDGAIREPGTLHERPCEVNDVVAFLAAEEFVALHDEWIPGEDCRTWSARPPVHASRHPVGGRSSPISAHLFLLIAVILVALFIVAVLLVRAGLVVIILVALFIL